MTCNYKPISFKIQFIKFVHIIYINLLEYISFTKERVIGNFLGIW